jgi:hypothetical protein
MWLRQHPQVAGKERKGKKYFFDRLDINWILFFPIATSHISGKNDGFEKNGTIYNNNEPIKESL